MSVYSRESGVVGGAANTVVTGADDARALAVGETAGFHVMATGQVESGEFDGADLMYCKYDFSMGPDWKVVQGLHQGTSQTCKVSASSGQSAVWNFPIDVSFKATSAFGWPRLVLSVHSTDSFDRDIIQGYGVMIMPTVPGRYVRYVRMFRPVSSSMMQEFMAWLTGNKPQFFHTKFVAQGDGREVTRVTSTGIVKVSISIQTKNMSAFGYSTGGSADSAGTAGGAGAGAGAGSGTVAGPTGAGGAAGAADRPGSVYSSANW